jgi:sigma-E factor negative regulatory protein RseA
MSEQLYEQISAFVDGELPEHETELLLKRLEREPELRAALVRYTAIGANLREPAFRGASRGFAARVTAAVATESPAARTARARRWLRPLAGVAVAATVAGVAIVGMQQLQSIEGTPAEQLASESSSATSPVVIGEAVDEAPIYTVPAPAQVSPIVPAARLTNYVVAHSQYSTTLGRRNVLSGIIAEDPVPLDDSGAPVAPPPATEP